MVKLEIPLAGLEGHEEQTHRLGCVLGPLSSRSRRSGFSKLVDMWARWIEVALGGWLVLSPWIFGHDDGSWFHLNDIISGIAVIVLASASFSRRYRWAHLGVGVVAIWLAASAYFGFERPGPPA